MPANRDMKTIKSSLSSGRHKWEQIHAVRETGARMEICSRPKAHYYLGRHMSFIEVVVCRLGSERETPEINIALLRNKTISSDKFFGTCHKTFLSIGSSLKMTVKKWTQP